MKKRSLCAVAMAVAALATGAPTATASSGGLTTACGQQVFEQPFLPWLDPAYYVLARDGGLEEGALGWRVTGGASVVDGNEPYHVHGAADSHALSLPSGSSATTPPICVGVDAPVARLFVVNSGSLLSTLQVDLIYRNAVGVTTSSPLTELTGSSTWKPTVQIALLANVTSLQVAADGTTNIALRFRPQGATSSGWRLDDVYVDPFKGN